MTEHHAVAVIGGGQAGLSVSWFLRRDGIEHIVLERETVGHEWHTGRWDNFTLVTPNFQCRLPGYSYTGPDPDGFMVREEVLQFIRGYAASFDAPVREHTAVIEVAREAGRYRIETMGAGGVPATLTADQIVIATGGYHVPVVPSYASSIPAAVHQLHSSQYRRADALPDGAVLVVGTGQSGAQIAEDLLLEGRTVHLAVGGAPRVARRYRGRDCMTWLEQMGVYDRPVGADAAGRAARDKTNHYVTGRAGGHDLDLRSFALAGMQLHGRLLGVQDGVLSFGSDLAASLDHADAVMESIKNDIDAYIETAGVEAPVEERYRAVWVPENDAATVDLAAAGITSVVWAIGYRGDYRWLTVPVFDGAGRPQHDRGVTPVPGCYFLGLPWLHTWGSGRFASVARDAEHLAGRIVGHHTSLRDRPGVLV